MSPNINAHAATMHKLIDVIWNARQLDRLREVFTEAAVIHYGDQDLNGTDEIREEFMAPFQAAFPDMHHSILDLILDGEVKAVMRFEGVGTHQAEYEGRPATNAKLSYDGIVVFRMDGDHVAEVWAHSNFATRFQDL